MKSTILTLLTVATLAILPGMGHGQDGMMQDEDMYSMRQNRGMEMHDRCMGPGGCGMADCGTGMRMMDGYAGRGAMGLGPVWMLDLSRDQRSKMNKIQNDLRKQHWALMGKILDQQAKLFDLYSADRPDPKKIGAVYGAIFDIRRQMIESKIDAMNRARDILSKEQQNQLKQFRQNRGMGPGGMMYGHERMRDMMSSQTGTR